VIYVDYTSLVGQTERSLDMKSFRELLEELQRTSRKFPDKGPVVLLGPEAGLAVKKHMMLYSNVSVATVPPVKQNEKVRIRIIKSRYSAHAGQVGPLKLLWDILDN